MPACIQKGCKQIFSSSLVAQKAEETGNEINRAVKAALNAELRSVCVQREVQDTLTDFADKAPGMQEVFLHYECSAST